MLAFYTQLLVHLDASAQSAGRLAFARQLAQQHGAALSALYAVTPACVPLPETPAVHPGLRANLQAFDGARRQRARSAFDAVLSTPGAPVAWTEVVSPPVIGAFAQQALYADLLVLGQRPPPGSDAAEGPDVPADFTEAVVALSGKPALVLPRTGMPGPVGDTVVIAWKETREAARAVALALPILRRARQVHVLCWAGETPELEGTALDLDGYLRRQQVAPVWHRAGDEPEQLGALILSRAADLGADLLVMGCYGHARLREWLLGGTSRTILQSMTLPVLLAH